MKNTIKFDGNFSVISRGLGTVPGKVLKLQEKTGNPRDFTTISNKSPGTCQENKIYVAKYKIKINCFR